MSSSDFTKEFLSQSSYFESSNGVEKRGIPKKFLSEYQYSYLKPETPKITKVRAKDTFSFESKSLLSTSEWQRITNENSDFEKKSKNASIIYKSKELNRLNCLLPEKNSLTLSIEQNDKLNDLDSTNEYKAEYFKQFDDINKGLVDYYSASKGGVLLKMTNESKEADSPKVQLSNDDKFRSIWIPKKFEGRSMFASHIGGVLFPHKKEFEFDTAYNKMSDSKIGFEKSWEKPTYKPIGKAVTYALNYRSQYVPIMKWTPKESSLEKSKTDRIFPNKSVYQSDFGLSSNHFGSYIVRPRESTMKQILNPKF